MNLGGSLQAPLQARGGLRQLKRGSSAVQARAFSGLGSAVVGGEAGRVMAGEPGMIRPLVAGNWKMNGLAGQLAEAKRVADAGATAGSTGPETMICPPATLVAALAHC